MILAEMLSVCLIPSSLWAAVDMLLHDMADVLAVLWDRLQCQQLVRANTNAKLQVWFVNSMGRCHLS